MDDVLVASRNKKKHQQATHELLEILAANDLFLKPEKCVWEQPHVDYLGLILEEGVTCMDPAKIAGIATWPTPTSVKQVRCYVLVERSARLELDGYDSVVWHAALEACASSTL